MITSRSDVTPPPQFRFTPSNTNVYVCAFVLYEGGIVILPSRPIHQMDTFLRQWEKRTRNIINKNANRYATDGVFFVFFFFYFGRVVPPMKLTQRQIADHFRTELYFLTLPYLHTTNAHFAIDLTTPRPCNRHRRPPRDIYIRRLKNNVLRVFLFHTFYV